MQALGHIELISFYVSSICHPIILGIDWIQRHEPTINWAKLLIDFESSYCVNNCTASVIPTQDNTSRDMDHMEVALNFSDKLTEHVYPYVSSTPIPDATLPEEILKEFSSIFDIEAATVLPSSSRYDFRIKLLPGFTPPHGKVYSLTPKEQVAMREYVDTNLKKGFIRPSTSPAAAPCFFVKKKDGTLRPIQDYRGLNSGTVKSSSTVAGQSTLTGRQSVLSPTLGRYVFTDTDWPLLISDFLTTDEWLPSTPEDLRTMCVKELSNFILSNNVLCRVLPDRSKVSYQPSWQRKQVYKRFHDGLGSSQSSNSTYAATPIRPVPSVAIPFERWGLDFIQDLPETKSGNRHIITAIDYASRWVVAKAVPNRDAVTVASFLYDIMMDYGAPYEVFTDRGSAFIAEGFKVYEDLQRIRHHATTPYHPQTNGMVERMHAMMGHAITTLTHGTPERWDEYLQQTVFSLRVRKHATTQLSPFFLLYGVDPRLPGDTAPLQETMVPLDDVELIEEAAEKTARGFDETRVCKGSSIP
ncbi:hypothetical protein BASA61_009122 [Batrachochytrium salamandrivorans]|nr:hypothetical protein BASA61_009122 [Batrachochytrium salamandrivorans]